MDLNNSNEQKRDNNEDPASVLLPYWKVVKSMTIDVVKMIFPKINFTSAFWNMLEITIVLVIIKLQQSQFDAILLTFAGLSILELAATNTNYLRRMIQPPNADTRINNFLTNLNQKRPWEVFEFIKDEGLKLTDIETICKSEFKTSPELYSNIAKYQYVDYFLMEFFVKESLIQFISENNLAKMIIYCDTVIPENIVNEIVKKNNSKVVQGAIIFNKRNYVSNNTILRKTIGKAIIIFGSIINWLNSQPQKTIILSIIGVVLTYSYIGSPKLNITIDYVIIAIMSLPASLILLNLLPRINWKILQGIFHILSDIYKPLQVKSDG